ncbi:hypothetical protein TNCV_3141741 [Trichonephila clavipes]|nr:hypothetical protein TNCV_3141741 [Trichonephila clavipes]
MITTNTDATDGLANGAVGRLVHVETNVEGLVKTVRLEFPVFSQIGEKLRHLFQEVINRFSRIIFATEQQRALSVVISQRVTKTSCEVRYIIGNPTKPFTDAEIVK